jgi:hypothetical protein
MRSGVLWMEIKLDGKNPKKEKNKEGHPRAHSGFFYCEEKNPNPQKDQEKKNPSSNRKREIKMAGRNTKGVDDEDGNERKAKGSTHVSLKRIIFLAIVGPRSTAEPD